MIGSKGRALKAESEPISDDEKLYRRVHQIRFGPPVSPGAFEPRVRGRDPDTDGISLYRAECLSGPDEVLNLIPDAEKRKANGIVAVKVADLKHLGLTVAATPVACIAGHVSVPEMSSSAMLDKDSKARCKERMFELAKIASRSENIIKQPG